MSATLITVTLITLAVITVAATRVTRLITLDQITEPARRWVITRNGADGWFTYLVHCPWCMGIWVAAPAAAIAWWATPLGDMLPIDWWYGAPALWLTIAHATGWALTRGEGR